MNTLVLLLPARSRFRAQGGEPSAAASAQTEYEYLLTADGVSCIAQGRCSAARLPRAETVVAVPAESDLSWRRVTLPKTGRARMRDALAGLLEEVLLDDPDQLHFALEAGASGGKECWVAVTHKAWLVEHLGALEGAQVFVDRVAPLSWPRSPATGHFHEIEPSEDSTISPTGLRWSCADGVVELRLDGSLARTLFPLADLPSAQWSATPASAEAAQAWLGTSVSVVSPASHNLGALAGTWNLRQFELAPRARGGRALRQLYRGFTHRTWRPVRWGLAGLIVVQLLGLNLWAWHQRSSIEARRAALEQTLRSAHPHVRSVLDAGVQMQRETALLRAAAGRPGDDDIETLLSAAANAWPDGMGPLDSLRFEPGRLSLSSIGWNNEQIEAFRHALQGEGWQLDVNEGRFIVSRARVNGAPAGTGKS